MFAILVILAWMLFVAEPGRRRLAAVTAFATPLLAASGLFLLRLTHQFAARPEQDVGFRGYLAEALVIVKGLTEVVCTNGGVHWYVLSAMIGALAAVTVWQTWKGGSAARWERRVVVLALGLVAGQALGVYAMDLVLSKHLATARYLLYAGPALAILGAIGATRIRGGGRWPARALLLSLVALQVAGVNWSRPDCRAGRSFGPYRPVAGEHRAEARRPALAVIGTGYGRGDLWSWVYELPAETPVLFLGWNDDGSVRDRPRARSVPDDPEQSGALPGRLSPAGAHAKPPSPVALPSVEEISRGLGAGHPLTRIAAQLGRSGSTVCREVARNGGASAYRTTVAASHAWERATRPQTCKLAGRGRLRRTVAAKLRQQWSAEQIAGWLRTIFPDDERMRISHKTNYRSRRSAGSSATARAMA